VSVSVSIYCSTLLPCHGCASEQRGLKQWALSLPSGTDRRVDDPMTASVLGMRWPTWTSRRPIIYLCDFNMS
jgi:hypothetical protein